MKIDFAFIFNYLYHFLIFVALFSLNQNARHPQMDSHTKVMFSQRQGFAKYKISIEEMSLSAKPFGFLMTTKCFFSCIGLQPHKSFQSTSVGFSLLKPPLCSNACHKLFKYLFVYLFDFGQRNYAEKMSNIVYNLTSD